ncbi:hypothetical protein OF83DRAFT_306789 [Amylostereum chailletii]|nr:hypothetical protein OF83DRAFT_306789 [Amylostereum chailletii]
MAEIEAKYAANTTFYDPLSCENRVMAFGGWTNLRGKNVFEPVRFLEEFNERFRLPSPTPSPTSHAPAFGAVTTFFDAVVSAWKSLGNKVVFEVVVSELNQEMAKMRSPEGEAARPAAFPREYTRMWLSNVPDYNHGLMNQIVYVLPSLQTHRHAGIASNCLLHTLSFPDKDDYCHTYTHLTPQDVPRYLNCRIDRLDPMTIELIGWNSPSRALATLPPRAAVLRWLTRVLLNILWPGDLTLRQKSYIGDGVRHTSSLNAFLALLLHLPTLGYPAHWLAEFVETLLADALWADVPLFVGPLPIPKRQSERKVETWRVRLGPWLPELRTLLALAAPIAPFPLPRLSAHAETMRKEGWVAVLFRYDNNTTVGKPMLASAWKKIEDIRAADA